MTSSIVFRRMYGWYYPGWAWDTYSTVNKRTYFCCEEECTNEAHVPDGRCDECHDRMMERLQYAHNPPHCRTCTVILTENLWGGDCEMCYNESDQLHTYEGHMCIGEFDYDRGCYVCDDCDDPQCPQYVAPRTCTDCGHVPEDGIFHCYRGNDALCEKCEEKCYGPPSPTYDRYCYRFE